MREGMRRGYTSPQVLMERMLPVLQALGEDTSTNVFYGLLRSLPDTIKEPDRTRLSESLNLAIRDKLLPAYRQLHNFIQSDYLPRARTSVALSALPLGPSWYAFRVKRATGSSLTPKEIHATGVAEVERIRARLQSLLAGAPADAAATGPAGVKTGANAAANGNVGVSDASNPYLEWKVQTLAAMPALFSDAPQVDLAAAPAGVAPVGASIALFLRDEIPGRHYQTLVQQARADLPKFRRFGRDPAFVDGWALYAESLGEELGLYRDDEAKRNALLVN